MAIVISADERKRIEFIDHTTFYLYDWLPIMGLKNPSVDMEFSDCQCAIFIDYTANVDRKAIADKIKRLVGIDLRLSDIEDADRFTVTVFDGGE